MSKLRDKCWIRESYWVSWDYDLPNTDLTDLLLAEINDLLQKHSIVINHCYVDDKTNGNDYKIELTTKKIEHE